MSKPFFRSIAALLVLVASACTPEDDHDTDHDTEVISRVELTFTPVGGGEALTFAFSDPDGDGGVSGVAEPIELTAGTSYTLELRFLDTLADPDEDITEEIRAEAEDHFVFVLGDVQGLTHVYDDLESDYGSNVGGDDLPVGLINTITTDAAGTGTLRIMLRHLPELNGQPQKTADLPQRFVAGEDLPGDVDVDLSFELIVL